MRLVAWDRNTTKRPSDETAGLLDAAFACDPSEATLSRVVCADSAAGTATINAINAPPVASWQAGRLRTCRSPRLMSLPDVGCRHCTWLRACAACSSDLRLRRKPVVRNLPGVTVIGTFTRISSRTPTPRYAGVGTDNSDTVTGNCACPTA